MSSHPWLAYKNWAVVGASTKPERYGYQIVKKLQNLQYNVLPITPKYKVVNGIKAYPSLDDIDETIDVVNFVVNPTIGKEVLEACIRKGIKRIWLQPGTVDDVLVARAKNHGIEIEEACILVATSYI